MPSGTACCGPCLTLQLARAASNNHPPVLMNQEQVEPVVSWDVTIVWHEHLDSVRPQLVVETDVLNVAYAIQAEVGVAFAQENRTDVDTFARGVVVLVVLVGWEVNLSKVVENARNREDVESAEGSFLR